MKNLTVFYHLFIPNTSGMWVWWVEEQLGLIKESGLADKAKVKVCITMPLGLVGQIKKDNAVYVEKTYDEVVLEHLTIKYPFIEILDIRGIGREANIFEGQTLKELYLHSLKNDGYVLYLHNKGATENFYNTWGVFGEDRKWRKYMQHHCVTRWKECVEKLDEGYDCVGANYFKDFYPFAGNFWWATTDHIKRLEDPLDADKYYNNNSPENYRYAFELWVGTQKPKIHYMDVRDTESGEVQKFIQKEEIKKPMNLNTYAQPKSNKFNLVRIVPDNGFDVHAQVFHEIEAAMFFSLQKLGYDVTNSTNDFAPDRRNIVFGMHHCPVDVVRHDIPKNTIVYSLEQMRDQPECMRWCRKYRGLEVWDYSTRNVEVLQKAGVENIKHCKVGYVPEISYFERNKPQERDIDILAYLSPSQRRVHIMDQFAKNPNINFVHIQSTYGDERDEYIKRAKLVINLHNHDNEIFEIIRVSHLIQNKVPVLCERNDTTDFPDYMEGTVFTSTYNRFVDTAYKLLKKPEELDAQAEKGLEIFKQSPMENFLKEVL